MNSSKDFLGRHRKSAVAVLMLVVLFVIASFAVASYETWVRPYREKKALEAWQAKLEKPYREDAHGGATPEETWGLFLDALRAGNIDLAVKYFVVDKQGEMKNRFEESIKLNRLQSAIKDFSGELKKEKDYLQKEKAYFFIPIKSENGEIEAYSIVFYLNPYTKVWKILVL